MHIWEIVIGILYFLCALMLIFTRDSGKMIVENVVIGVLLIIFSPCVLPFLFFIISAIGMIF